MNSLLNNWSLKLTALLLAIGLWGHVRGETNPLETATFSVKLSVPVVRSFVVQNRAIVPETVRVTIRAPRLKLREIKGALPANPLAPPDEAPRLAPNVLSASLDFSNLKLSADSPTAVPVKVDSQIDSAEIIGVKPDNCTLILQKSPS